MIGKILCVVLLVCISLSTSQEVNTIAHTKNGAIRGRVLDDVNGGKFVSFKVIPYAKPPIGELRFKAPQPAEDWDGIRDGNKIIPMCSQMSATGLPTGKEDCLYLNVYTPEVNNDTETLRPVMFFVHGGSFISGSSMKEMYGPEILITENIVLVTLNYRLGALGFLSLDGGISEFSSNNGLKDQVFALKWVQENINQFGGDPNQVTIFGESAGSTSVHYLILSPLSKGLFHRAISQSGTAFGSWAVGMNNSAIEFAKLLDISIDDLEVMVKELRQTSQEDILVAQNSVDFSPSLNFPAMGAPSIEEPGENSFLPNHPRNIMQSGNYNKVPWMLGFNNEEGILSVVQLILTGKEFVFDHDIYIPYNFDQSMTDEIKQRQKDFYWNGNIPNTSYDCIDIYTDSTFKYSTVRSAREHANHQTNIFLYEFTMDTKLNFFKRSTPQTAELEGASHCDDLGYMFSILGVPEPEPGSIEEISLARMVRLWTNFAKHGNPTPIVDELLQKQIWFSVTKDKLYHMHLGENLEVKIFSEDRYDFWEQLYQDYDIY